MAEDDDKKGLLDQLIDAVSDRDEKAAAEEAAAREAAAKQAATEQAAARNAAAAQAAAEKAAAEAAAKKAAEEEAAKKAAAEEAARKANAEKLAAIKAAAERTAAANKAAAQAAAAPKKGIVQVRSLRIRKDHTTDSSLVGGLVRGDEVTVYETWTDGKDTWARIGDDQWAALVYEGETYISLA